MRAAGRSGRIFAAGQAAAFALILVLLALAPFAAALEIHHALAEADHDGHAHSDFDLCQWVQLHSASSCEFGVLGVESPAPPREHDPPVPTSVRSATLSAATPSRAPPHV